MINNEKRAQLVRSGLAFGIAIPLLIYLLDGVGSEVRDTARLEQERLVELCGADLSGCTTKISGVPAVFGGGGFSRVDYLTKTPTPTAFR